MTSHIFMALFEVFKRRFLSMISFYFLSNSEINMTGIGFLKLQTRKLILRKIISCVLHHEHIPHKHSHIHTQTFF